MTIMNAIGRIVAAVYYYYSIICAPHTLCYLLRSCSSIATPLPPTMSTPPLRTPIRSKCRGQHHRYYQFPPRLRQSSSATEAVVIVVISPVFLSASRADLRQKLFHVSYLLSSARPVVVDVFS